MTKHYYFECTIDGSAPLSGTLSLFGDTTPEEAIAQSLPDDETVPSDYIDVTKLEEL